MPDAYERITPDRKTLEDMLLAVGHAIWELQTLEDALATHLVLRHDLQPGCSKAELEQAMERRRAMTFGQLIKRPEMRTSLPQGCLERLSRLKDDRNWLVHSSRRSLHVDLYTRESGAAALARVETITDAIGSSRGEVVDATMSYLQRVGRAPTVSKVNEVSRSWALGKRHADEIGET